jgi:type I restriction enzyme S subunit
MLPTGWISLPLEDVASVIRGITFPAEAKAVKGTPGTVVCLRTSNVQEALEWDDVLYVPDTFVKSDDRWLEHNDIVISMANSYELVGKVALAEQPPERTTFGGFLSVIRARGAVDGRFLFYQFRSQELQDRLRRTASRTVNIANISLRGLHPLTVVVPPIGEQRRIVAKLDELRARSRKAREALDQVPALLDQLKQSVLAAAFRGDLTAEWRAKNPDVEPASVLLDRIRAERRRRWEEANPKKKYVEPEPVDATGLPELPNGWCWATIEEITEMVTSGSRGWGEYYTQSGARFLRVGNLKRNTVELDLRDIALVSPPDGAEGTRTTVRRDDVLVSITADVGMVAHIHQDLGTAYINQHVALLRPTSGLHARCFAYSLVDPTGLQRLVRTIQYGMTKASLSLIQVRALRVPVVPQAEAVALAAILDARLTAMTRELEVATATSRDLNSLNEALLAAAFRGALLDEPVRT